MKNSVEEIMRDMKRIFKELEVAYGDLKPQLCEVKTMGESCPNNNCWINRARNEYFDRVCELERGITEVLDILNHANSLSYSEMDIKNRLSKLVTTEPNDNEKTPKVAIQF